MAKKRMFSLSVVDTDKFLEMPISSRLLYYELGMRADDDGFVDNWKKIMLFTGLKEDDMKVLISKQFIIPFESGVIVIRHWRLNNYLQNDRAKPTIYQEELKKLELDNNNVYNLYTKCIPSIDKNSIDKNSIDIYISKEKNNLLQTNNKSTTNCTNIKNNKKTYGEYKRIKLTDKEYNKLIEDFGEENLKKQIKYLDEYIESNNNKNKYTNFNLVIRKSFRENWFKNNIEENNNNYKQVGEGVIELC